MLHTSCCLSSSSLYFFLSMPHGILLSLLMRCSLSRENNTPLLPSLDLCLLPLPLSAILLSLVSLLLIVETPLSLWLPLTPSVDLPSLACVDCWVNIVPLFSLSLDVPSLFRYPDPPLLQRFYHQCYVMPPLCWISLFRCHIFPVKSCRRHHHRVWYFFGFHHFTVFFVVSNSLIKLRARKLYMKYTHYLL